MDTENTAPRERTERPERTERSDRPERSERGDRNERGNMRGRKRRKVCAFCVDKVAQIDYKDAAKLRRFISERGKILPCRMTGTCADHQRQVTIAIKRARQIALLPFVAE
jgi:small subunit ribosomal protein S18